MSPSEIRAVVLQALKTIAPESEPESLAGDADVREELDIDSMDFLHVVAEIHRSTGVDVPERDYSALNTVDGAVRYLVERLG